MSSRDVVSGRLPATPADLQQPLAGDQINRPVVNRETSRETSCPHTDRSAAALCVLPAKPRGSHYVICPCCGLSGWQQDGDVPVMVCPDCLVPSEVLADA